jgi:Domain of unknown function (DUF4260)
MAMISGNDRADAIAGGAVTGAPRAVGIDRLAGYGLKHPTGFGDTHLGRIGRIGRNGR